MKNNSSAIKLHKLPSEDGFNSSENSDYSSEVYEYEMDPSNEPKPTQNKLKISIDRKSIIKKKPPAKKVKKVALVPKLDSECLDLN